MRKLGIDYGDARVGISITDPLNITVQGLETIQRNNSDKVVLRRLDEILEKYEVDTIVVGMPYNLKGEKTVRAEVTEKFIHKLKCKYNKIKIETIDERLTTVAAHKTMNFLDINKNKKRDTILVAAAGVVMNFLLAFVCMILHGLLYKYGSSGLILNYLYVLTYYGAVLNIGLGVFNLIPIPPLDGSNILAEIFPRVAEFYWKIRPYSMWILLLLLGTGILDVPISLLNSAVINGMWSFVKAILRIGVVATGGGTVI